MWKIATNDDTAGATSCKQGWWITIGHDYKYCPFCARKIKRVFVELYPEDALEAIEILFNVEKYSDLNQRDMIYIPMARDCFNEGVDGLWKFVDGFRDNDPAIPYQK